MFSLVSSRTRLAGTLENVMSERTETMEQAAGQQQMDECIGVLKPSGQDDVVRSLARTPRYWHGVIRGTDDNCPF